MQQLEAYSILVENAVNGLEFPVQPANLYDPLRYFMTLGGKRMRPILTLMGSELFGGKIEQAVPAAMAVEVFHNFTLIHDDIMDEAPLRRGKQTVHTKWDRNIAILSGDVLFVKAYQLLAEQDKSQLYDLLEQFNKTAIEVCEGQQMDMDFETRSDVQESEYIEMIRLKTSVLLGCALELGAIAANADLKDRKHLYDFGQYLGIAFQIQDDILDLYADPDKFGKQVGGDVISNKKTLLNLKAYALADETEKEILRQLSTEADLVLKVEQTRQIYTLIGAREACEKAMKEYYSKAMNALNAVNVSDTARKPLIALADLLMIRNS
ncbi:MAG: polyprenyl synthetase family protein [Flavobacteriia bacterium]|jgi:geranylgeranyl diphosphate synthase type II